MAKKSQRRCSKTGASGTFALICLSITFGSAHRVRDLQFEQSASLLEALRLYFSASKAPQSIMKYAFDVVAAAKDALWRAYHALPPTEDDPWALQATTSAIQLQMLLAVNVSLSPAQIESMLRFFRVALQALYV